MRAGIALAAVAAILAGCAVPQAPEPAQVGGESWERWCMELQFARAPGTAHQSCRERSPLRKAYQACCSGVNVIGMPPGEVSCNDRACPVSRRAWSIFDTAKGKPVDLQAYRKAPGAFLDPWSEAVPSR